MRSPHSGSSALLTRACITRSLTVGMPKGRVLPFAFGMYTRLAGLGLYRPRDRSVSRSAWRCFGVPHRRRQGYCARGSAGSLGGSPAASRIESGRAASGGSSPSRSRRPLRHGRSVPAVAVQPPPPRPSRCRTTVEGVVQWSVRFAPSNVSTGSGAQVLSFRWTTRKSASFRTGYPRLAAALSVPVQDGLCFLRDLLPPAPSPFLAVRIPPRGGVHGTYPVA
jgi:hypothetical protein